MATGKSNHTKGQGAGIPVNWSEADWAVEIECRMQNAECRMQNWSRGESRDSRTRGARVARDAWFIWRTSQTRVPRRNAGFTLIELLVVIAVIAILAGLLLPTLMGVKVRAKARVTRTELGNLATAIKQYEAEYSRPPLTKDALNMALQAANPNQQDFTYGGRLIDGTTINHHNTTLAYRTNNAELIAILQKENQTTIPRLQALSRAMNPRQIQFFDKKHVEDVDIPGIGPDNVFRDPWGNPYFISIDVNDDGVIFDGLYGSIYARDGRTDVGIRAPIAIWSAGPDLKVNPNQKSKELVNRDNIVSWE